MNRLSKLLEKRWVAYTVALSIAVILYMVLSNFNTVTSGLYTAWRYIWPVVLGAIIAYLVNPIVTFFENKIFGKIKKEIIRRGIATVFTLVVLFALLGGLMLILIPSIRDSIISIRDNFSLYQRNLYRLMDDVVNFAAGFGINLGESVGSLESLMASLASMIKDNLDTIVSTAVNTGVSIANFLIGLILAIYFLMGKSTLLRAIKRLRMAVVSEDKYNRHTEFLNRCNKIFLRFIGYDLLDGIIIGILNAIIMLIIGMPYVPLVSVIVGVTNLLPTFGPIIGAVLGGILLLLENPWDALIFLIITAAIQTLDGYIIKPRLFGGALGIPSMIVLVSIVLGGNIFGVIGIFLAIPFMAIFIFVYDEAILPALVRRRERREQAEKEKKEAEKKE